MSCKWDKDRRKWDLFSDFKSPFKFYTMWVNWGSHQQALGNEIFAFVYQLDFNSGAPSRLLFKIWLGDCWKCCIWRVFWETVTLCPGCSWIWTCSNRWSNFNQSGLRAGQAIEEQLSLCPGATKWCVALQLLLILVLWWRILAFGAIDPSTCMNTKGVFATKALIWEDGGLARPSWGAPAVPSLLATW